MIMETAMEIILVTVVMVIAMQVTLCKKEQVWKTTVVNLQTQLQLKNLQPNIQPALKQSIAVQTQM